MGQYNFSLNTNFHLWKPDICLIFRFFSFSCIQKYIESSHSSCVLKFIFWKNCLISNIFSNIWAYLKVKNNNPLDRWILSRITTVAQDYHNQFVSWDFHKAGRDLENFVINFFLFYSAFSFYGILQSGSKYIGLLRKIR